jgi:hypothetical protein
MTTDERRNLINAQCRAFLEEVFEHDDEALAYWLSIALGMKQYSSFTNMSFTQVRLLAEGLTKGNDSAILFSDLVLKYGFGCEVITMDQVQQAIKEEGDGYCLDKVMVAA